MSGERPPRRASPGAAPRRAPRARSRGTGPRPGDAGRRDSRCGRAIEDADVQPAADQPFFHIAAEALADMQPDARKIAPNAMEQRLDQDHADRGRHAEIDGADRSALGRLQASLEPVDLLQQRAAMFQHGAADLGQFRAAAVAPQQRRAAFRLELPDVAAQRRLRDPEVTRGKREAAQFADTDEIASRLRSMGRRSLCRNRA